jgi:hypothetical protein
MPEMAGVGSDTEWIGIINYLRPQTHCTTQLRWALAKDFPRCIAAVGTATRQSA